MIERSLFAKLLCIALVAVIMLPVGSALFPYVSAALSDTQFHALEALISASVGYGISGILG